MTECGDHYERNAAMPCMAIDHDLENYYAQIEMPGVRKEDIDLTVTEGSFCVKGKRGDKELSGCWMLGHPVNAATVKAKYSEGLLDIVMPLKHRMSEGKKVKVE